MLADGKVRQEMGPENRDAFDAADGHQYIKTGRNNPREIF